MTVQVVAIPVDFPAAQTRLVDERIRHRLARQGIADGQLEQALQERQRHEYNRLTSQGRNLGKLFLLDRTASYDWLSAMKNADGAECAVIPTLSAEDHAAIVLLLKERESFKPWTHKLVETISTLPFIRKRFPYNEYVQKVGRLEADGWLVRVYVNHDNCDR